MTLPANTPTAYNYFLSHGFTPAQAAGICGNLIQESNINPEDVEYGGGPGRGIAQWSLGGRWQPRLMTGNPATDLGAQLDFIIYELDTVPAFGLAALKAATDPVEAAQVFGTDYERYGIVGARLAYAQQVYDLYNLNPPPPEETDTVYPILITLTGQPDILWWGGFKVVVDQAVLDQLANLYGPPSEPAAPNPHFPKIVCDTLPQYQNFANAH